MVLRLKAQTPAVDWSRKFLIASLPGYSDQIAPTWYGKVRLDRHRLVLTGAFASWSLRDQAEEDKLRTHFKCARNYWEVGWSRESAAARMNARLLPRPVYGDRVGLGRDCFPTHPTSLRVRVGMEIWPAPAPQPVYGVRVGV